MSDALLHLGEGAWVHDLSPFLLRFGQGSAGIRWYGLTYIAGFVVAYFILRWLSRRGLSPLREERVLDAMTYLVAGLLIGGRAGSVLFYQPKALTTFTPSFPFWEALAIHHGGMAYHGAMAGVAIASIFVWKRCCKRADEQACMQPKARGWFALADCLALACTIGLGLGRVANFINGELLGKVIAPPGAPGPWWGVRYPQEILSGHDSGRSPEQAVALERIIERFALPSEGTDLGPAAERLIATIQRGGSQGKALASEVGPLLATRFPSQLLQAFFEGVVLTAIVWVAWKVSVRSGIAAAWFILGYGVLRIIAEFYRLPDVELGRAAGLSRGQWLSVLMVIVGLVVFVVRLRSPKEAARAV